MNYSTQLLEQLNVARYDFKMHIKHSTDLPNHKYLQDDIVSMNKVYSDILEATKFLFPANLDVGISDLTQPVADLARLPYKKMVFEYADLNQNVENISGNVEDNYGKLERIHGVTLSNLILLTEETYKGQLGFCFQSFDSINNGQTWGFIGIKSFFAYCTVLEYDGNDFKRPVFPLVSKSTMPFMFSESVGATCETPEETFEQFHSQAYFKLIKILKALACLNAKNISTVSIAPPKTANALRASKRKPPLFSYRVCHIFLGDSVIGNKPRDRELLASQLLRANTRLHAVRGHFKKKKNGIFWWSSFIRGDKSNGVIAKDYQVDSESNWKLTKNETPDFKCFKCQSNEVKYTNEVKDGHSGIRYHCNSCNKKWWVA